jgi:cytochrome c oxidase subunit 1
VFSGKPVFGYVGLVLSAFAIAGLSMGVWAHHMFTTGAVANGFFSGMSFLIAVPTGVKFWNWIGTMWRGKIRLTTPMLFAIGFLLNFLVGGVTGVMIASPPIDYHAEDSYFIVSHFHYTLGGGSLFALFAAIYFWCPKMFGFKLNETLGKIGFWSMFIGFNITFLPMYFMGIEGMPRRVYTYPAIGDLTWLNQVASVGAGIIALSVIVFIVNVVVSKLAHEQAEDDPWDAFTLEWGTSSPPPEFNFHALPPIRSERPVWDMHHPELAHQR